MNEIRIGASGWHYKHWLGTFYPARWPTSRMLEYYERFFDSVEINNSFYRLPSAAAFDRWRDGTPPGFCFAVKGSRFLTHMKKLKDPEPGLERFLDGALRLGPKLGPLLWQLPPFWERNVERLEGFLNAMPRGLRCAFEFRNPTWHDDVVYAVLRRHNAAFCMFDLAGFQSPEPLTADWTYIRLHGPGEKYQGSYSPEALAAWAGRIESWRGLRAVYCYFDNDQAAYAVHNARELKAMVGGAAGVQSQ